MFQGHIDRANNNYIQYIYSYIPPDQPGGGGWSLQIMSLDSLYEDWLHLENIWTTSNAGLPLVRYIGTSFKLYQSDETDYVFMYDNCWPMTDTIHKHADSSPFRMLQQSKKIVVPSRRTQKRKKPYKKVFIKPPAQMLSKWYFQQDICKIPLLMYTTTAISLPLPFCKPECKNNNLTIYYINPYIFKNSNFQHLETSGYYPKFKDDNQTKLYLYTHTENNIDILKTPTDALKLIPLANTKNHTLGKQLATATHENEVPSTWGNPFHETYTSNEMYNYISELSPLEMWKVGKKLTINNTKSATLTGNIIHATRYNPQNDTGSTNKAFLVNNELGGYITEPANENYIIDGFPLFYLLWGWVDWIRKLGTAINIDTNYFVTIKTKATQDTRIPYLVPVDESFLHGKNPYEQPTCHDCYLTDYNQKNWYPRHEYQKQTINNICLTGPASPKPPYNHYLQALAKYKVILKWGGCPKSLQKAYSPCSQPRWPTTDNIIPANEITNPNTNPKTELYNWDWQNDYVKECALQRIADYTETDGKIFSITASKNNPPPAPKTQKKTSQKKEEEKIQQQLQLIRYQRVLLELRLRQQLKSTSQN